MLFRVKFEFEKLTDEVAARGKLFSLSLSLSLLMLFRVKFEFEKLTDEVAARGKRRPRRPRPRPRDAPMLRRPDAAGVAVRDAGETAVAAPDDGADGRPRGRPSAGDAAAAAAAAVRMPPDGKRLPFPAS